MKKRIVCALGALLVVSSGTYANDGGGAGGVSVPGEPSVTWQDWARGLFEGSLPKVQAAMNWDATEPLANNIATAGPFHFGQGPDGNKRWFSARNQAIAFKAIVGYWIVKKIVKKLKKAGKKKKHKAHHTDN